MEPKKKRKTPNRRKKRKKKVKVSTAAAIVAAAVVLAVCIGLPALRHAGRGSTGSDAIQLPPARFSAVGIDISHNNRGPIVWDSLRVVVDRGGRMTDDRTSVYKVYPVKFVFIKATEGATTRDPKFRQYWAEAGATDIGRGAYHFFRSSKDGAAQARHFISTVGDLRLIDLPPVLDIETIHRGCSTETLNARALEWLEAVEQHYGRTPIIYTSDYFARDILSKEITSRYPVWIAHYGVEKPDFMDWEYWQFSDRGTVLGVPGKVDVSFRR